VNCTEPGSEHGSTMPLSGPPVDDVLVVDVDEVDDAPPAEAVDDAPPVPEVDDAPPVDVDAAVEAADEADDALLADSRPPVPVAAEVTRIDGLLQAAKTIAEARGARKIDTVRRMEGPRGWKGAAEPPLTWAAAAGRTCR
jgi:hypothetical protein